VARSRLLTAVNPGGSLRGSADGIKVLDLLSLCGAVSEWRKRHGM
jgi:hypothetical protein